MSEDEIMESPTILRRYLSTFIDGVVIIVVFVVFSFSVTSDAALADNLRAAVFLGMLLAYEPIFTSRACTIGQKLTRIRVRTNGPSKKLSLTNAYLRFIVKLFLGFISLMTIPCTQKKRAIHDFACGSTVIMVNNSRQIRPN